MYDDYDEYDDYEITRERVPKERFIKCEVAGRAEFRRVGRFFNIRVPVLIEQDGVKTRQFASAICDPAFVSALSGVLPIGRLMGELPVRRFKCFAGGVRDTLVFAAEDLLTLEGDGPVYGSALAPLIERINHVLSLKEVADSLPWWD